MKSDFDKNFYLFFLSKLKGLSNTAICRLLLHNEQPGLSDLIARKEKDKDLIRKIQLEFNSIKEDYIGLLDDEYPDLLRTIYDPPLFLFYRGNINLLQNKDILTIVGSRTLTTYHKASTEKLIANFTDTNLCIASGLALGIDSVSHQAALDNDLPTIAVLGSGLDESVIYPQTNIKLAKDIIKKDGLLLSEYPMLSQPRLHHFPRRNRILAGLSPATVVISGALKSGTLITAQVAIDEGRDVYALPGNVNLKLSSGPNSLIANGAQILSSSDQIFETYNIKKLKRKNKIIFKNKDHAKIYSLLQTEPMNLEQLAKQLQVSLPSINIFISELEIRGLVKINQSNQVEII